MNVVIKNNQLLSLYHNLIAFNLNSSSQEIYNGNFTLYNFFDYESSSSSSMSLSLLTYQNKNYLIDRCRKSDINNSHILNLFSIKYDSTLGYIFCVVTILLDKINIEFIELFNKSYSLFSIIIDIMTKTIFLSFINLSVEFFNSLMLFQIH